MQARNHPEPPRAGSLSLEQAVGGNARLRPDVCPEAVWLVVCPEGRDRSFRGGSRSFSQQELLKTVLDRAEGKEGAT